MKKQLLTLALSFGGITAFAQNVGISAAGATPDNSAVLDVASTTKGMLLPRMTQVQRNAITLPANGLMVYQTDNTPGFYYNGGTTAMPVWTAVSGASGAGAAPAFFGSAVITATNTGGTGTNYFNFGTGASSVEADNHRMLSAAANTIKLRAVASGSLTSSYTLKLRKGVNSGTGFTYSDLSSSTLVITNATTQTITITNAGLVAGNTIAVQVVGTAAYNSAGQQRTIYYTVTAE